MNTYEQLQKLILVGYNLNEISKHTSVNRSTLSKILKNKINSNTTVNFKINDFFNKNIESVELGKLANIDFRRNALINTPDGWQSMGGFVEKGLLPCKKIIFTNHETIAADEHLFQMENSEWLYTKALQIGDKVLTDSGIDEVKEIIDMGMIKCYDITVNHENHRYYLDGIASHNTGKSLLAALIMSNALKQGYDAIFYFDSEGGGTKDFFENVGCDTSKIYQILVSSVEDAQLKILDTYNTIIEIKKENPEARFLCVLDSLGALVAEKVLRDADKGKVASEMGGRAKQTNNLMKALTIPALQTDTAMIVLNHVYDDPSAMYTNKIKNQGGGKGLQYMCSINIQCTRNLEKDEDTNSESYYGGTNLKFFTVKNRMARPSLECEVYLDFKKGFTRQLKALFDEAVRGGFITCPSQGYYCVPSSAEPEKKRRRSEIENNAELWKTFLKDFDEWSMSDLQYSKLETIDLDDEEVQENLDMLINDAEEQSDITTKE